MLLVIALLVAGVWLLIAQPWSGNATAAPAPVASPTASSSPTATEVSEPTGEPADETPEETPDAVPDEAVPDCTNADVTVEAATDQETYAADQRPALSIRLTNTSAGDCVINVGTSTQSFTVASGDDAWWRSTDCQSEPSDSIVTLAAGQTVTSAEPLVWDRTRSSVDTCEAPDRPVAPAGGASYHLEVEIGGIASTGTAQFFLD